MPAESDVEDRDCGLPGPCLGHVATNVEPGRAPGRAPPLTDLEGPALAAYRLRIRDRFPPHHEGRQLQLLAFSLYGGEQPVPDGVQAGLRRELPILDGYAS